MHDIVRGDVGRKQVFRIKQKRSEIIMSKKRSDTPLLQECFAIAGRQNRESVVEWKKRIAACLEAAGAWMLPEERGENEISFRTGDADGGRSYRYRLQILLYRGR